MPLQVDLEPLQLEQVQQLGDGVRHRSIMPSVPEPPNQAHRSRPSGCLSGEPAKHPSSHPDLGGLRDIWVVSQANHPAIALTPGLPPETHHSGPRLDHRVQALLVVRSRSFVTCGAAVARP